jgi:hypothetical protein
MAVATAGNPVGNGGSGGAERAYTSACHRVGKRARVRSEPNTACRSCSVRSNNGFWLCRAEGPDLLLEHQEQQDAVGQPKVRGGGAVCGGDSCGSELDAHFQTDDSDMIRFRI